MKTKFVKLFLVVMVICFAFVGCSVDDTTPINVTFKNATYLGSENYTVTIVYQEDKRIRQFATDVLIKTDTPVELKITKELGESWKISLEETNTWQSLTTIVDKNFDFATFATVQTTTYIINASQKCTLGFKVIGGNLSNDKQSLENVFDASRPFELKIEKTAKIT